MDALLEQLNQMITQREAALAAVSPKRAAETLPNGVSIGDALQADIDRLKAQRDEYVTLAPHLNGNDLQQICLISKGPHMDTIVKVTPDPCYLGDTVTFLVSAHKTPGDAHHRVLLSAYVNGQEVYSDGLNVNDALEVSFVLGGSASAWTESPAPAHLIAQDVLMFKHKETEVLATMEFDSPGARP